MNSPALHEALLMASQNQFDVLIVREIDRFARSLAKQLIIEQEFKKYKVELEFVLEAYTNTPEGSLHKNIKAVIAEYERVKIIERTVRGRRQKVRNGNILVHGKPPYGYRLRQEGHKSELIIHEAEARIIRLIYQWYIHGDDHHGPIAPKTIANNLCEMGVPLPTFSGHKKDTWSRITVQRILANETYAGLWHYGKFANQNGKRITNPSHRWMPVAVPAILPRKVWLAAQKRRKENRQINLRNTKNAYLLGKRATCSLCGALLSTRTSGPPHKSRLYYYCASTEHNTPDNKAFFRAEQIDNAVWGWVNKYLGNSDALENGYVNFLTEYNSESSPLVERIEIVKNLLHENRQQLQKILDLYIDGKFSRDLLEKRKKKFEGRIYELASELERLTERMEYWLKKSETIESLKEFISDIHNLLNESETNFFYRRRIIEYLDVRAAIVRHHKSVIIKITFELGEFVLTIHE
jgi:site-specific DNA recombinase